MIKESWIWVPTGHGRTKSVTGKRTIYVFKGGLANHPRRGDLCVLDFGGLSKDYWIVQFVSGKGHNVDIEFVHENNLEEYKGE